MATPTYNSAESLGSPIENERKTLWAGYVFGAPVKDMGWFASLLMALATGMTAFFLATFLAIFSFLFWNVGHTQNPLNFNLTYRWVGLPVGATVLVLALLYMGMLWVRRITRKA
jgi:hypothetical protein